MEEVWHHMLHPSDSERIGWAGGGAGGSWGGHWGDLGGYMGLRRGLDTTCCASLTLRESGGARGGHMMGLWVTGGVMWGLGGVQGF